jgi:probable phosphoglycerate mutase
MTPLSTIALPITLLRHGETDWNAQHLIQGHDDRGQLNEEGREQARVVANELTVLDFDLIVSSDLRRTRETTAIVNEVLQLPIEFEPLLRERSFGAVEGESASVLRSSMTGISKGVLIDPDARPLEGESFRDVVLRAQLFLDRVEEKWSQRRLLVITHGGTVRALQIACSREPLEGMPWHSVGNCSLWTVQPQFAL